MGQDMNLRKEADEIIEEVLLSVQPDCAVKKALKQKQFQKGKIYLVAVGKAAWQMAKAASECLTDKITRGIVITKYDHVKGEIPRIECCEAGHPLSDENSFRYTQKVLDMVSGLNKEDTVLFLLSGGGSALFEKPLLPEEELIDINHQLLACGADIVEINTIRKRLSAVKGGKFAKCCEPASVYSIILSDILGDPVDMIASGPACADGSTCEEAMRIVDKYQLSISSQARQLLETETPKAVTNAENIVMGSVKELCRAAEIACRRRGYQVIFLTDRLNCEARGAGTFLAAIAQSHQDSPQSLAFLAGGETVVHIRGSGKGGRNQELALSAADGIAGLENTAVFSVGSDGTDGPTNAAGGYVDQDTKSALSEKGWDIYETLQNNDAYHALEAVNGLIITGSTGTNVNDVSVLLIKR